MRTAFILSFVANLILTVAGLLVSPATVATHFGSGGAPDGWAPAYVNALIMSGVNTLLFVSLFYSAYLTRKLPARWLNIPNKDYWLREENLSRMEALLSGQLLLFGTVTFAFLFILGVLSLEANLADPVRFREELFWWPFGLFMAYMVYWTIKATLAFRIPAGEERG
jgi:uncharacterized membrane protein